MSGTASASAKASTSVAIPPRTASPLTAVDDGRPTAVYVASLTWWTTDAELEGILAEFGRVKSLTFFADKATGKSKGCCAVEFTTSDAAAACKEKLHGRQINGKACVVTFAEIPKTPAATIGPNDPLPPPPDTAWKGPIPQDKPGYGGVLYAPPKQMVMTQQQQGKRAPPPPPPQRPAQWQQNAAPQANPHAKTAPPPPPKRRRR